MTTIYKKLLTSIPGKTSTIFPTISTPSELPLRRIPSHYHEDVDIQIQEMLDWGFVEVSNSHWMAPAMYVRREIW